MENRLKPETAPVIQVLRNANIRPVMVTGDNMLTAVSVARDCEIIDELDRIIIVSAKPPPKSDSTDVVLNGLSDAAGDITNPVDPTGSAQQQQQHAPFLISLNQLDEVWPTGSNEPYGFTATRDHPLVEFHYAEDLHKPVTEVTVTSNGINGWRNQRVRNRQFHYAEDLHKPVTEVTVTSNGINGWRNQRVRNRRNDGSFSTNGHNKSLFSKWTNCFRKPSNNLPCYGAVPTTAVAGLAGVAGTTVVPEIGGAQVYGGPDTPWCAPATNRRVTIRMIDRPDFHLAISGKTWGVIKKYYPWLIPKLVVKGTVFARFSPDQKTQLIEALQSVGYFVAMCGDGANDCGALKAAHAGISLSEAEASVASPFTSKSQHIGCVPTLIRQGRCALVTSFGTFKFMSGYSLVQFFTTILLYTLGSTITDEQFLFIDLFLITTLSITYGYTRAYSRLSVEPPIVRQLHTSSGLLHLGSYSALVSVHHCSP
ncbi:hypothetical protein PHET_08372 [Paragonimus heterotremus]|uniref:Uncharacterized protein n=1 Tax=Paragonimus heterotremus TaxID=100268 RepID=A0A8J4WF18_9TREM|nr:hypothetical protein PHET_08372 [Paragonimus heterotremus]